MLYSLTKLPTEAKIYRLINLNLFSGSSDTFRTVVGGWWNTKRAEDSMSPCEGGADDLETESELVFRTYDKAVPLLRYFDHLSPNTDPDVTSIVSEYSVFPNEKIPIRVFGTTGVSNDKYWKDLFLGGSFSGEDIKAVYNEDVFMYSYFESSLPYPVIDAAVIKNNTTTEKIEISYDYNNHLPTYEEYVRNLDSELLIPNFYVLTNLQSYDLSDLYADVASQYDVDVINYATLEMEYPQLDNLFIYDKNTWPIEVRKTEDLVLETAKQRTYISSEYLSFELLSNPLCDSTQEAIKHKFQNMFLDDVAINKLYNVDNIMQYAEYFPYYIKINFPFYKNFMIDAIDKASEVKMDTRFTDCIIDNNYTTRFLKTLKEVFNEDLPSLQPEEINYAIELEYLSSSKEDPINYHLEAAKKANIRTVDFVEMLSYTYNNYNSVTDDCYFIGGRNLYRDAVFDDFGEYRFINTVSSVDTLECAVSHVNNENVFDIRGLQNLLYQNEKQAWSEVVAYRIQKVGGKPIGDAREQKTIQNYWLINPPCYETEQSPPKEPEGEWIPGVAVETDQGPSNDPPVAPADCLEEFNFIDTQVKYGQNYTYHVFAYVLVVGARYKFSDLRLTQGISVDNYDESTGLYGLEFYDPKTGEKTEMLYKPETSFPSEFATLVQEKSQFPYLADFYLNSEPCIKILEMPMYSKTLKVLDNPPNETDVVPYQHLDASRQVGFGAFYDSFADFKTFPSVISSRDEQLKEDYMHARDLLEGDALPFESVSRPRYLEVYRTDIRPTSYVDFNNKRIGLVDLRSADSKESYTTEFFDDKILSNKKYYYLFRILNEQFIIGHTSGIYETELINDGGYLYALFNVLSEEDLQQDIFVNPSKKFKKLIHVQPSLTQLSIDAHEVDYNERAETQIDKVYVGSADDLIWGKTFKIRLTSEKTGKKIDLNITYNLSSI